MTCVGLLLVAKLTNVLDDLLTYRGPRETIVSYICALLPGFFHFSLPLGGFLAGALGAARFRQNHEFTAIWASGNSLRRVLRPVIFLILLSVPAMLIFENNLLPQANKTAAERYRQLTGWAEKETEVKLQALNLHLPEISLHAPAFDFKTLASTHVVVRRAATDASHLNHVCNGFERTESSIRLKDCKSYRISADFVTTKYTEERIIELRDRALAEALAFSPQPPEESNFSKLIAALRYNGLRGIKNHVIWTEFFSRLAYAFTLPLAAGLGFLLGLRFMNGGLALVLSISLVFAIIYYSAMYSLRALGNSGVMPASLSAALPNLTLAAIFWKGAKRSGI